MTMHLGEATIGTGSSGDEVRRIQQILQGQGYNVGPVDGLYGPQTQSAVVAFQKTKGLMPDGIVGPLTWAALQGIPPAPAPLPGPVGVPIKAPGIFSFLDGFPMPMILGVVGVFALVAMGGKRRK